MSTEGSTTTESSSTPNLYPAEQPVVEINNNLDDAEPQPNNEIIQNIVSKLRDNNNKGGKRKTRTRQMRKTRTRQMRKTMKTRTSNRKSRKMRKSK